MKAVGLRMLKNKLSEYVRSVAETGETILVTDHERVIAELRRPDTTRSTDISDQVLSAALHQGIFTPSYIGPSDQASPPRKPITSFNQLMKDYSKDRGSR